MRQQDEQIQPCLQHVVIARLSDDGACSRQRRPPDDREDVAIVHRHVARDAVLEELGRVRDELLALRHVRLPHHVDPLLRAQLVVVLLQEARATTRTAEDVKICSLAMLLYTFTKKSSLSSRPWFMSP